MNDKTVLRKPHDKEHPYVVVSKTVFEEPNVTWKAKGLMGYLLSRPDDWTVRMGDLVKRSRDGMASVRTTVNELIDHGYMTRERIQTDHGWFQWTIEVYETPIAPSTENPSMDKPSMDNPQVEDRTLVISDLTETECNNTPPQNGDSPADLFPEQDATTDDSTAGDHSVLDHKDPISMMAHCAEKRDQCSGGAPDWAMRTEGVHPMYPVVAAFCAMTQQDPSLRTAKECTRWLTRYERIGHEHSLTPADLLQAHEFLPDKDRGAWHIEHHKWSTPYNDSYEEQLVLAAMQVKGGTITLKGSWSKGMP